MAESETMLNISKVGFWTIIEYLIPPALFFTDNTRLNPSFPPLGPKQSPVSRHFIFVSAEDTVLLLNLIYVQSVQQ